MTIPRLAEAAGFDAGNDDGLRGTQRYDGLTMILHWMTALLVVTLFGLAHIWPFFQHDGPTQITMQTAHVSLGVLLSIVLITRMVWRSVLGRRLPQIGSGPSALPAQAMHYFLYGLLVVMVVAGFGKRWIRGHGVEFFGGSIPSPFTFDPSWRLACNWIHHWGAWALIVLAGLHAAAACIHHVVLRDGVLRRMFPA
ncbi:cytochrome b [Lichenifustis flavocetrariae]|uniref:Cytochrome b n=1 Tax=Lichenifustis flavocetrariae TaxID=2949735 RepID=A0AA42CRT3_9HYPH|nr:cytochrome b [Lichenifustis flavocetrariae]MCW6512812.1 cytochrome b [Lichenifustis flavocetrariae]